MTVPARVAAWVLRLAGVGEQLEVLALRLEEVAQELPARVEDQVCDRSAAAPVASSQSVEGVLSWKPRSVVGEGH